MDYNKGAHLAKWQWDVMREPAIFDGVFDSDEEGMMKLTDQKPLKGTWRKLKTPKSYKNQKTLTYDMEYVIEDDYLASIYSIVKLTNGVNFLIEMDISNSEPNTKYAINLPEEKDWIYFYLDKIPFNELSNTDMLRYYIVNNFTTCDKTIEQHLSKLGLKMNNGLFSILLPNKKLVESQYLGRVSINSDRTYLGISFNTNEIALEFDRYLQLKMESGLPLIFGDEGIDKISYNFATQDIKIKYTNIGGKALQHILTYFLPSTFSDLLKGTPMSLPYYNPLTDCDIVNTFKCVLNNFNSDSKPNPKIVFDIENIDKELQALRISCNLTLISDINLLEKGTGIVIVKDKPINITIELSGNIFDLLTDINSLKLQYINLKSSNGIIINYQNENLISVKDVDIKGDLKSEVKEIELYNTLEAIEGIEKVGYVSYAIFIGLTSGFIPENINISENTIIKGITKRYMNQIVEKILREFLKSNKDYINESINNQLNELVKDKFPNVPVNFDIEQILNKNE
jgi:hypothetical protein